MYKVQGLSTKQLQDALTGEQEGPARVLCRLIIPQQAQGIVDEIAEIVDKFHADVPVIKLSESGWREVNRNVPQKEQKCSGLPEVIAVFKKEQCGPILVLCGLKFRGNIGTIVRSAVQANTFESVYLINERGDRQVSTATLTKSWAADDYKPVSMKDIYYYSMYNAPLIDFKRFGTVDEFLATRDTTRPAIAIELASDSINLYSKQALDVFKECGHSMYLFLGAEDTGTPSKLLSVCDYFLELPSLSASINVSSAFMACLSIFMLSCGVSFD